MPDKTGVYLHGRNVVFNNESCDEDLCVDISHGAAILRNNETEIYGAPSRNWEVILDEHHGHQAIRHHILQRRNR
jgi:hypothetical protein